MQMKCKKMQIMAIQFQSKATLGNKSIAGLVMGERVHQLGQHRLSPAPLTQSRLRWEGRVVLEQLGWGSNVYSGTAVNMGLHHRAWQCGVQEKARAVLAGVRLGRLWVEARFERKL